MSVSKFFALFCYFFVSSFGWHFSVAAEKEGKATPISFLVEVNESENGTFKVTPPLPEGGKVEVGTTLTLHAEPALGFEIDSLYAAGEGFRGWTIYLESMDSPWEIVVEKDLVIGASFIAKSDLAGFEVIQDVVYAQPGVKPLKYDVFSPEGAKGLPAIIIIHGGGWSANTEDIMRGLARELVRSGEYVVCSIDYRWIGKLDGDEEPNEMKDLIEDVFGAIAHIQEHADRYGIDPAQLAVTGDSAGGHLSASAINMAGMIGERGFGELEGVYEYLPTYVPKGKSVSQLRDEISASLLAAAPSYGVFGGQRLSSHGEGKPEGWLEALSPIDTVPAVADRAVPQLLLRGTKDWIKDEDVQAYADALAAAGHRVEYVQIPEARHAFFDWKPNAETIATFKKFGVPSAATMKRFFDSVFYPEK